MSREVATILDRLGTRVEVWGERMNKLFSRRRLLGGHFASDRPRLRETIANGAQIGIMHLYCQGHHAGTNRVNDTLPP